MSTLQNFFIALGASLIAFWLIFALRKPRNLDVPDVLVRLRYGSALRVTALVLAWTPPAVMIYVVAKFAWSDDSRLMTAGVSFTAVSLVAGLLLIEAERLEIAVTETGLSRYSPWTGRGSLTWGEIERIEYSPLNRWLLITGAGRAIRLSRHLVSIGEFIKIARRKLAVERYVGVVTIFNALAPSETKETPS